MGPDDCCGGRNQPPLVERLPRRSCRVGFRSSRLFVECPHWGRRLVGGQVRQAQAAALSKAHEASVQLEEQLVQDAHKVRLPVHAPGRTCTSVRLSLHEMDLPSETHPASLRAWLSTEAQCGLACCRGCVGCMLTTCSLLCCESWWRHNLALSLHR